MLARLRIIKRTGALTVCVCVRARACVHGRRVLGHCRQERYVTDIPLCCPRRHKQLLEQYKQKLREAEDATAFARDGTKSPPRASVSTIVASPRTPGTRDGAREGDAAAAVEPDVPADTVATEPEPAKRSDNGGNIGDVAPEARTNVMALHRSGKTVAQIRNHYLLVDYGLTEAAVLAIIHEGREEAKAVLRLLPALADAVTISQKSLYVAYVIEFIW